MHRLKPAQPCPSVARTNSRQEQRAGGSSKCHATWAVLMIVMLGSVKSVQAGLPFRPALPEAEAASSTDAAHSTAAAGAPPHAHGRSLKQLGYDPYGIGYYDPYQAGVTPGFVNVDLNRETGLHVDVGTVAVDVSADKNYYGLGVGNLVGVGAAKDRGWNLQIGGGNILDVSVTKDAGLGLWLLNGLANIQIGPDGRGWETGHIAAQSVPGQASAAAAGTAGQPAGQQVTSVVVDEPPGGDGKAAAAAPAVAGEVHAASDSAEAMAVEEPIITEEPISPELTAEVAGMGEETLQAATAAAPQPSAAAAAAAARSSAARRAKPRKYIEARPAVYVQPRPVVVATEEDTLGSEAAQFDGAAAAAAAVPQYASQPAAGVQPAVVPLNVAVSPYAPAGVVGVQQVPAVTAAAAAAPRRACEGGVMVAVAGNKLKCKYRKGSRPAHRAQAGVASSQ